MPLTPHHHPSRAVGAIAAPAQGGSAAEHDPVEVSAAGWLVRQSDGLTADEALAFRHWLAADARHRAALARLGQTWDSLSSLPAADVAALRQSALLAKAAPAIRPVEPPGHKTRCVTLWRRWQPRVWGVSSRLAATALVLCVGVAVVLQWHAWQEAPVYSQGFATQRGQQLDLSLPDGSQLKLDTATQIHVTLFRQRHEVRLVEGQAMFTVQTDAQRPFDVLAGPLAVRVVGTRFSVRHAAGEATANVVVQEGRVRVQAVGGAGAAASGSQAQPAHYATELAAGDGLSADAGRPWTRYRQPGGTSPPWTEKRANFDNTPLKRALAEFERYLDTRTVLATPEVAEMRLSGSFDLRQFDVFLKALPQVLPVRVRQRTDGWSEVVPAG